MSAQLLALAGVVIGALLAGAGNLLLAWRDETIQARTGVYLIRRILEEARDEVSRLRGEKQPRWSPEQLPDSKLWAEYRTAVGARLALARLQKIDEAMRNLDKLNEAAARAGKLGDDLEGRILDAAERHDAAAKAELEAGTDPQNLTQPVIDSLPSIQRTIEVALEDLVKVTPTGLPGRTRNLKAFKPWYLWHWRSISAAIVAACLVIAFVWLGSSGTSTATAVQDTLAAHFGDPAFTACEPVSDHDDDFSCVVVEKTTPAACAAKVTSSTAPQHIFARDIANAAPAQDKQCGLIAEARQYSAQRQHDDDCTAFFETGISSVPAGADQSSPGFLRRMKAMLRREAGSGDGVPPVIVPGSAFTADC